MEMTNCKVFVSIVTAGVDLRAKDSMLVSRRFNTMSTVGKVCGRVRMKTRHV